MTIKNLNAKNLLTREHDGTIKQIFKKVAVQNSMKQNKIKKKIL